ncbi:MAG: hypothetical protein R3F11_24065 [Verrucomicrobiales bacterium]
MKSAPLSKPSPPLLRWFSPSPSWSFAEGDKEKSEPKHDMETIMKKGMKGDDSLVKKIVEGRASDEEKALFTEYCEALCQLKPEKGSDESWKEKTRRLPKCQGRDAKAIEKAANCKACHSSTSRRSSPDSSIGNPADHPP